jgi:Flp pilus assembly protein CpaB
MVQAVSAAIVALLTLVLAVAAAGALLAANRQADGSRMQAEASTRQAETSAVVVEEMRRERHTWRPSHFSP